MKFKILFSVLPMLSLGACAVSPESETATLRAESQGVTVVDADTGEAIAPIESLEVADAKVEFFDFGEGDVRVIAWGKAGTEPAITPELSAQGASALTIYEKLAGKPAPSRLAEAQARADFERTEASKEDRQTLAEPTVAPSGTGLQAGRGEDGVGAKQQELITYSCSTPYANNDAWFNCNFCKPLGRGFDYTWMFSTGSGRVYREDVTMYFSTVYVWSGNSVILDSKTARWSSWVTRAHVVIPNGYYAQASHRDSSYDFDMVTDVVDAVGDAYHWCSVGY